MFGRNKPTQPPPQPIRSPDSSGAYGSRIEVELEVEVQKLRRISQRMTSRGKELFEKCVRAQQQKDAAAASMYAAEAAEMRKMSSVIIKGELSLERVLLRLKSIQDFKQAIGIVMPAIRVIGQVQSELSNVVPEVSADLAQLNDRLDEVYISAGIVDSGFANETTVADQEAQKILQEASAVAEQRVKNSFPDLQQLNPNWETGRR